MALTTVDQGLLGTNAQYTGFKNRIINGGMQIDQRNGGSAITTNTGFPVDRFILAIATDGVATAQQSSTAPAGFTKSLVFTTTTADASLAATQYLGSAQQIEGLNVSDLAWGTASAATVTLSFWTRSSLTGTFSGSLRNSAGDRSYVFTYTISAANTWERKSITIAGDTGGTWLTDNGIGIRLWFSLGTGSTYSTGTTGSWVAANYISATGSTSVIGTLGATFYITGVQLEKGSTATSFDYRPYTTELQLCQRYFQSYKTTALVGGPLTANTNRVGLPLFPVPMRVSPVWTFYNRLGVSGSLTEFSSQVSITVSSYSTDSSLGGGYVQTAASFSNACELRFEVSAEF